jgi:hypothetical protein
VPGDGGENVGGARVAGGARCAHFAHGMHEAAVADRGEQERESEIEAKNACAQVAVGERDGVARPEGDVLINAAVFAQRNFAFGAAIEVIEDGAGTRRLAMARKSPMLTTRGEATERADRVIPDERFVEAT